MFGPLLLEWGLVPCCSVFSRERLQNEYKNREAECRVSFLLGRVVTRENVRCLLAKCESIRDSFLLDLGVALSLLESVLPSTKILGFEVHSIPSISAW